jgi:riboflavin synthase
MFTGIINNTGKIHKWQPTQDGGILYIKPKRKFTGVKTGESIAINGCCLTVTSYKNNVLQFDVSDETMRKTALGAYEKSDTINMERAMQAKDRFGGHFVLGHVDGVGKIKSVKEEAGSVKYTVSFPKKHAALLIEKGSVTIDGISLTVCDLKAGQFNAYIIPHTIKETHLGQIKVGSQVNLEFDVLGKYVLRQAEAA